LPVRVKTDSDKPLNDFDFSAIQKGLLQIAPHVDNIYRQQIRPVPSYGPNAAKQRPSPPAHHESMEQQVPEVHHEKGQTGYLTANQPAYPNYRPQPISYPTPSVSFAQQPVEYLTNFAQQPINYLQHQSPPYSPQPHISFPVPPTTYTAQTAPYSGPVESYAPEAAPESYGGQNENYANEQDSGLFRPLLDQSRKGKDFMSIVPYKDNDPVRNQLRICEASFELIKNFFLKYFLIKS
jgi:hypothetical protein